MLRRLAYLLVALFMLIVLSLPIFAIVLAARGEIMVGSDQGAYVRLFLVSTDDAEGIGIQRFKEAGPSSDCLQGSVRYLLWEGASAELDANYCTCFDSESGYAAATGECDNE
jgi:hypothetical protein